MSQALEPQVQDFGRRLVVYYHRNSQSLPFTHQAYELPVGIIVVDELQRKISAKHLRVEQIPVEHMDITKLGADLGQILTFAEFNLFERHEQESFEAWLQNPQHERYRLEIGENYFGFASTHGYNTQMCNHHSKGSEPLSREKTIEQQCEELFQTRVLDVMKQKIQKWTPEEIYQTIPKNIAEELGL